MQSMLSVHLLLLCYPLLHDIITIKLTEQVFEHFLEFYLLTWHTICLVSLCMLEDFAPVQVIDTCLHRQYIQLILFCQDLKEASAQEFAFTVEFDLLVDILDFLNSQYLHYLSTNWNRAGKSMWIQVPVEYITRIQKQIGDPFTLDIRGVEPLQCQVCMEARIGRELP